MIIVAVTLTYEFEYPDGWSEAEIKTWAVDDFNEAIHREEWFDSADLDIEIQREKEVNDSEYTDVRE